MTKDFSQAQAKKNLRKALLRDHKIYIPSASELEEFNCVVQPLLFFAVKESARKLPTGRIAKLAVAAFDERASWTQGGLANL